MDIVERLRHKSKHSNPNGLEIYEEAADEIERLRAELARAHEDAKVLGMELHAFQKAIGCGAPDQVAAALRERLAQERERCAKACESLWNLTHDPRARMHANKCASAIRATGDAE